jgi:hypothetical protein
MLAFGNALRRGIVLEKLEPRTKRRSESGYHER